VLDEHILASVNAVDTHDPETGSYQTLHYTGCVSEERAKEVRQALYRAAKRNGVSLMSTVLRADDGTWYVEFCAVNKAHGQKYVLEKYGRDRQKWPYSPIRGDKNYG
jgi:hypothetical protein